MIRIQRPPYPAQHVFATCISRIGNQDLKRRLTGATPDIVDASNNFDVAAANNLLHQIPQDDNIGGQVSGDEMVDVYNNGMLRRGAPGRAIYDALRSLAPNRTCPLCDHGIVATLDHHLPKTKYPALAVAPLNLVPACKDCNGAKRTTSPKTASDETLHPYYDNINGDRWLYGEVKQVGRGAAVKFFVQPPAGWTKVLAQRVDLHFRTFGLGDLYGIQAASELGTIRFDLQRIHSDLGKNGVREQMEERALSSRQNKLNDWHTATYEALAASDWFCDGGFG